MSQCDGCAGERQVPNERVRFDVRTAEWLCPQCLADSQAWAEDEDPGPPVQIDSDATNVVGRSTYNARDPITP